MFQFKNMKKTFSVSNLKLSFLHEILQFHEFEGVHLIITIVFKTFNQKIPKKDTFSVSNLNFFFCAKLFTFGKFEGLIQNYNVKHTQMGHFWSKIFYFA